MGKKLSSNPQAKNALAALEGDWPHTLTALPALGKLKGKSF